MVEGGDGGAPESGVGVEDCAGHEDDGILFQEVLVFEEGVAHDLADGGAKGVRAEHFLECGAEDWTIGFQPRDIESAGDGAVGGWVCSQYCGYFGAEVGQDGGRGVDMIEHPCYGADRASESAD